MPLIRHGCAFALRWSWWAGLAYEGTFVQRFGAARMVSRGPAGSAMVRSLSPLVQSQHVPRWRRARTSTASTSGWSRSRNWSSCWRVIQPPASCFHSPAS